MDAKGLLEQAALSAATWMAKAVRLIDEEFGEGYARAHPELVGAFINAASRDYAANWVAGYLGDRLDYLADTLDGAIANLAPGDE